MSGKVVCCMCGILRIRIKPVLPLISCSIAWVQRLSSSWSLWWTVGWVHLKFALIFIRRPFVLFRFIIFSSRLWVLRRIWNCKGKILLNLRHFGFSIFKTAWYAGLESRRGFLWFRWKGWEFRSWFFRS